MTTECKFGTINIETGEIQEGFVQNGEMKYKKQPWYKRIFQKRPESIQYIKTTEIWSKYPWTDKFYHNIAVYKRFNPFSNKTYQLFAKFHGRTIYFNTDVFEKEGRLIIES